MATPSVSSLVDGQLPPFFTESWFDFYSRNGMCRETLERFRTIIFHHYLHHRRDFSWREEISPYRVLVSEVMLQQTQTSRVVPVFERFIGALPDFRSLAGAPFAEVLGLWKGLGYNRRARYLQETAVRVIGEHDGILPDSPDVLVTFPGIGPATAASICVFACNQPLVFIETNIRTVFLHFFFPGETAVHDRRIMPLVERTLEVERPRDWYYALMDYGVLLKRIVGNAGRRSSHYHRQSPFAGSDRQLRGRILQQLLDCQLVEAADLAPLLGEPSARVDRLVDALCDEGLVVRNGTVLALD
ncbi:MAG: A/G-specific adenine glycosylase [Desulfofustis sp.]|nr:A/G-specific adenine glycosylase [Desulfofustis sp.]